MKRMNDVSPADFAKVKCFLLDMDGTFYLDDELIDGALSFIDTVVKPGAIFCF